MSLKVIISIRIFPRGIRKKKREKTKVKDTKDTRKNNITIMIISIIIMW